MHLIASRSRSAHLPSQERTGTLSPFPLHPQEMPRAPGPGACYYPRSVVFARILWPSPSPMCFRRELTFRPVGLAGEVQGQGRNQKRKETRKRGVPCGDRKGRLRPGQTTAAQTAGPAPGILSSWARPRLLGSMRRSRNPPTPPGERYTLPPKPLENPSCSSAGPPGLVRQLPCALFPRCTGLL